jgi:phosphoglycolate phosphatase
MLKKPKIVLFDWDNTLVDSWGKLHKSINHTFSAFGLPEWSLDETKEKMHLSLKDCFPSMFGNDWLKAKDLYYDSYKVRFADIKVQCLDNTENTLKILKENNIPIGLVSNKNGNILRTEVTALNWDNYFEAVVGSTDALRDKPHPEPALLALSKISTKVEPGDVWFVGDTIVDVECALNSGCYPIYFGPHNTGSHPKDMGYMHTHVAGHAEFFALFDKL